MPGIYSAHDAIIGVQGTMGGRGGGASFVGAYDAIPSISAAYGMRRLLSSYTGALVRLRRASDNAESDFGYTSTGDLDTAAIATWLTATTGYRVTWYDQSGGEKNLTQSTAANQPLYVASGQNSRSVSRFDGVDDSLQAGASLLATNAIFSLVIGTKITNEPLAGALLSQYAAATAGRLAWIANQNDSGANQAGRINPFFQSATSGAGYAGAPDDFAYAAPSLISFVNTGAAEGAKIYLNGTVQESFTVTSVYAGNTGIGRDHASILGPFDGDIYEIVIASAAWSDANRQAAEAALNTYWSIY